MGLLDASSDQLRSSALNTYQPPRAPEEPGVFHNFGPSAGNYFMRGFAEAGRAASMAAGSVPVMLDWAIDPYSPTGETLGLQEKKLSDRYFEWHDRVFGNAVDFWTPRPEEVGAAGQVVGTLGSSIVKFLANPALSVADAQLSGAEGLVRQGVDSTTAQVVGGIEGTAQAVGIRAPAAFGTTLAQRIATGAGFNVAQNAGATELERLALQAGGASQNVVNQFDPFDGKGRLVDALMGAVFGAKAHLDASGAERDALLTMAQARHIEDNALPGKPTSLDGMTKAVNGTRQAMEQMLRGEPVGIGEPLPDFRPDPQVEAFRGDMAQIVEEQGAVKPTEPPKMIPASPVEVEQGSTAAKPPPEVKYPDELKLPTGEFDADGVERTVSANELIASTRADAEHAKTHAEGFMRTAAECLLGSV